MKNNENGQNLKSEGVAQIQRCASKFHNEEIDFPVADRGRNIY